MRRHWFEVALCLVVALVLSLVTVDLADFKYFYGSGLAVRAGESPYHIIGFVSPLHLLFYTVPISLLPYSIAFRVHAFLTIAVSLWIFRRWSLGYTTWLFLALAPWALLIACYGQIEWLVLLGSIVNPLLGVFLFALKPQVGGLAVLVTLLNLWRSNRSEVLLATIGLAIIFGMSLLSGMHWPDLSRVPWNTAVLWPWAFLLAIPFVVYALATRRTDVALAASCLYSPYVNLPSWSVIMAWASRHRKLVILFTLLSWALIVAWRIHISRIPAASFPI